jgi:TonB family protein
MWKIKEYDRKRNRRLLLFIPVSLIALFVILISLERSQVVERIFTVGYEGPPRFVPTITIVEEKGIESEVTMPEQHRMVAERIVLENEEPEEEDTEEKRSVAREDLEDPILDDQVGKSNIRSSKSRADVPYREDYVILKMVKPDYPPEAIRQGLEGYVIVELYVGTDGTVAEAWVRSAYGIESFEVASLEAVRQFLFKPITENGSPIPFWVSFLITFKQQI